MRRYTFIFNMLNVICDRNRFVEVGSSHEDSTEYVIVLIFESFAHFKVWEESEEVQCSTVE